MILKTSLPTEWTGILLMWMCDNAVLRYYLNCSGCVYHTRSAMHSIRRSDPVSCADACPWNAKLMVKNSKKKHKNKSIRNYRTKKKTKETRKREITEKNEKQREWTGILYLYYCLVVFPINVRIHRILEAKRVINNSSKRSHGLTAMRRL